MKTAEHVDIHRSITLAGEITPVAAKCYWNAHRAALAIGANATYCEGWVLLAVSWSDGRQGYKIVAHGWVELAGQIIDMEGAGAVAYFASTHRVHSQVGPDALPLHMSDRQADRRHQRSMHKAIAHMLTLSPAWASIIVAKHLPIV